MIEGTEWYREFREINAVTLHLSKRAHVRASRAKRRDRVAREKTRVRARQFVRKCAIALRVRKRAPARAGNAKLRGRARTKRENARSRAHGQLVRAVSCFSFCVAMFFHMDSIKAAIDVASLPPEVFAFDSPILFAMLTSSSAIAADTTRPRTNENRCRIVVSLGRKRSRTSHHTAFYTFLLHFRCRHSLAIRQRSALLHWIGEARTYVWIATVNRME